MLEVEKFNSNVRKLLLEIGIPCSFSAYKYIISAAEIIKFNTSNLKITVVIYPIVAEIFSTKACCVERNIRHAVERSFTHGDIYLLREIFKGSINPSKGKVSNMQFIYGIIEFLTKKE